MPGVFVLRICVCVCVCVCSRAHGRVPDEGARADVLRFFALQTKGDHKSHVVRRGGRVTLDLKRVDTCAMRSEYVIMYTHTHSHNTQTHTDTRTRTHTQTHTKTETETETETKAEAQTDTQV